MKQRMYICCLYQLSAGQIAAQSVHAVTRYGQEHPTHQFTQWANEDHTVIILSGGTTNKMRTDMATLSDAGVKFSSFSEPDLDNIVTAYAFLADERTKMPLPEDLTDENAVANYGGKKNIAIKQVTQNKPLA